MIVTNKYQHLAGLTLRRNYGSHSWHIANEKGVCCRVKLKDAEPDVNADTTDGDVCGHCLRNYDTATTKRKYVDYEREQKVPPAAYMTVAHIERGRWRNRWCTDAQALKISRMYPSMGWMAIKGLTGAEASKLIDEGLDNVDDA
jgi:hypothetical protein